MRKRFEVMLVTASHIFAQASMFAMGIVLARYFSQQDYGTYLQVMLICSVLIELLPMGIQSSLFYFLPRVREKAHLVVVTLFFLFAVGTISAGMLLFFSEGLSQWMNNPDIAVFSLFMASFTFLQMPTRMLESLLISCQKVDLFIKVNFALSTGFFFALLVPVLLSQPLAGFFTSLLVFYTVQFVVTLLTICMVAYSLKSQNDSEESYHFISQLKYSLPIGVSQGVVQVGRVIDKAIVSFHFAPAQYAVYARGAFTLPFIGTLENSMSNVLMPSFISAQKAGDYKTLLKIWHQSVCITAVMIYPIFCYFFSVGDIFIPFLFSDKYVDSGILFQLYLLSMIGSLTPYNIMIRVLGATTIIMYYAMTYVVINMIFILVMLNVLGLVGIPLGMSLSIYILRFLYLRKTSLLLDIPLRDIFPWRNLRDILFVATLALIPVIILRHLVDSLPYFWMLSATGVFYGITYLILLKTLQPLNKTEQTMLREMIPAKLRWVI